MLPPLWIVTTRPVNDFCGAAMLVAAPVAQRRDLILVTLCLAVLIAQVDTSVVNLALRPIADGLDVGIAPLQWVVDGYNLAYALFILTGGLLADLYGRRRVFVSGVLVFSAGCLVCGLSPNAGVLIFGRVVAGLGAAMLQPASLAILRVVWTDIRERGRALGVWASCNGIAFVIGPTIGGVLIKGFGWRSVFLVVLPLGIAAIVLAWRYTPESSDPSDRHGDLPGQALAAIALGGLALASIEAHERPLVCAVALPVAIIAAALLVMVERRHGDVALVPPRLFRKPAFAGAIAATAAMTFGMYGLLFLTPLSWQGSSVAPLSAVAAGLALMPMALAFVLVSRNSGALAERFGARVATGGGTAMIGIGLIILALTASGRPIWLAEIGMVLAGIGMGANTGPLMGVAVAAAPAARSGTASSLINVARMVGATLGVAILGAVYALLGGGALGFTAALTAGGVVQLTGAAVAWATVRDSALR
jgi:MFS transporter, DHA2 family, methylenomycin A resistance protein